MNEKSPARSNARAPRRPPPESSVRALRADAVRNRARILAAAAEVFADRGLDATLDDIAAHAGVGVGTVYRRFRNKEALVDALFEKSVDQIVDLAKRAQQIADSWDGLVLFLELATQMQAEDFGLRDVMLHDTYGQTRVAEAKARIVPLVTELVERAHREGQLRDDFVTADLPIIELMLASVATYTSDVAPELWRRYFGIVLDGICAKRTSHRDLPPGPTLEIVAVALHRQPRRR